ncbi:MAG: 30S ribosomal protein S17 [candidate division NC10 bacterium]|nr:30S ribosomal protein S17 [candidate division NC10 bacterium]
MRRERGQRKVVVGRVVSDKMDKTVIVQIERLIHHSEYNKIVRSRTRVKAHDEANQCRVGDKVRLMETRPLSREKRWRVVEIVEKAL